MCKILGRILVISAVICLLPAGCGPDQTTEDSPTTPTIEAVELQPEQPLPEDVVEITVAVDNPDDVEVTYDYEATGGFEVIHENGERAEVVAPGEFGVSGELTVVIGDVSRAFDQQVVELETRTNDEPVIESVSAVPEQYQPGETGTLTVEASDPDGDELFYHWSAPDGWELQSNDEPHVELTAPHEPNKVALVELVVDDGLGGEATTTIEVSTRENTPPEIVAVHVEPPQVEPGGEIELEAEASDPDGDDIEFQWHAPGDWTLSDPDTAQTTITAPDEYNNSAHVELEVIDEHGAVTPATVIVSTITNQGPQIESISADPTQIHRGETSLLNAVASHPEDAELDYEWWAPDDWEIAEDGDQPAGPVLMAPEVPGETASVGVVVTDPEGNEAMASVVVSTLANQKPTIESLDADPTAVVPEQTTTITAVAGDPDGEELTYQWDIPDGWNGASDDHVLELTAPETYGESGTVGLTVDDGWDTTTATVSVSTVTGLNPTISSLTAAPQVVGPAQTSQLVVDASHPYGESLDYTWSVDDSSWTVDAGTDTAELTAPDAYDESVTVQVVVEDEYGATNSAAVVVETKMGVDPVISSLTADPQVVGPEQTSQLVVDASHPYGESLDYTWSIDDSRWTLDAGTDTAGVTAPDAYDESVTVQVVVEDEYGGTNSAAVVVETKMNISPIITSLTADPQIAERGGTSQLEVEAFDPNGDELHYNWSIDGDNAAQWALDAGAETAELTAPTLRGDEVVVQVIVDDGYGEADYSEIVVVSEPNNPPVIEEIEMDSDDPADQWVEQGGDASLFAEVTNLDGDDLDYNWEIDDVDWGISANDASALLAAPDDNGVSATVELTVSDGWGGEDSATFEVRTRDLEPDAFEFDDVDDAIGEELVVSNAVELQGFDGPVAAECNGCELSINGDDFTGVSYYVYAGDSIRIRTTSADAPDVTVTADVTVANTLSAEWSVTTDWGGERMFTRCGQSGHTGPGQSQCNGAYNGTALEGEVNVNNGFQRWVVPFDGIYQITAIGAGSPHSYYGFHSSGSGIGIQAELLLEAGDELEIVVGQRGTTDSVTGMSYGVGGGGGSFVVDDNGEPLIVAGGGGGAGGGANGGQWGAGHNGFNAVAQTSGADGSPQCSTSPSGGQNGHGGSAGPDDGGGAGLLSGGQNSSGGFWSYPGGEAYVSGAKGGGQQHYGGFGGGASAYAAGGGGGGYSGGGGGDGNDCGFMFRGGAGGGGSFITADALAAATPGGSFDDTSNAHDGYDGTVDELSGDYTSYNSGHGEVFIELMD